VLQCCSTGKPNKQNFHKSLAKLLFIIFVKKIKHRISPIFALCAVALEKCVLFIFRYLANCVSATATRLGAMIYGSFSFISIRVENFA
jgi:hypothetical protein